MNPPDNVQKSACKLRAFVLSATGYLLLSMASPGGAQPIAVQFSSRGFTGTPAARKMVIAPCGDTLLQTDGTNVITGGPLVLPATPQGVITNLWTGKYTVTIEGIPKSWLITVTTNYGPGPVPAVSFATPGRVTYVGTNAATGVTQVLNGSSNVHLSPAVGTGVVALSVDAVPAGVLVNGQRGAALLGLETDTLTSTNATGTNRLSGDGLRDGSGQSRLALPSGMTGLYDPGGHVLIQSGTNGPGVVIGDGYPVTFGSPIASVNATGGFTGHVRGRRTWVDQSQWRRLEGWHGQQQRLRCGDPGTIRGAGGVVATARRRASVARPLA